MIDFIFIILIIIACIKGYKKGLVVALFSILAFIVGLAAALKLSAFVAEKLKGTISLSDKWLPFISFALVFIIVVIAVNWAGKLVEKAFQAVLLGSVNRVGGVLLYIMIYLIIFSIFLFYGEKIQLLTAAGIQASKTYPFVKPWGPKVINGFGEIVPVFKDMFTSLEDFFARLPQKISS